MVKNILNKTAFKVYNFGWTIAIPFLKKNRRMAEGYEHRILDGVTLPDADVWIQAASGGEAYLALELLKQLSFKKKIKILITSNTTQGLEILNKGLSSVDGDKMTVMVSYSPFDHPGIISLAVRQVNPDVMVLLELELWPGLLTALKKNNSKTIIINGRLTQKSLKGYLKWPSLWREIAPLNILAISPDDAGRFKSLFPDSVVDTMQNIKFDRVTLNSDTAVDSAVNPLTVLNRPHRKVIVLGSVRAEEEGAIGQLLCHFAGNNPDIDIWLFPRHMERVSFWEHFLEKNRISWAFRSECESKADLPGTVILWDCFGELTYAYEVADAAFVGGSLAPLGGQNFLEVLSAGLLPVTGPSWENFLWTGEDVIQIRLLFKEENWEKVYDRLLMNINNPVSRQAVRTQLTAYLDDHQGGTLVACEKIKEIYYDHC